jgi:hypothetical protein
MIRSLSMLFIYFIYVKTLCKTCNTLCSRIFSLRGLSNINCLLKHVNIFGVYTSLVTDRAICTIVYLVKIILLGPKIPNE